MAVHQARIGAIRAIQETAFNTPETTLGSFFNVPVRLDPAPVLKFGTRFANPMHLKQRLDGQDDLILMPFRPTLEISVNLQTFSTKAVGGGAPVSATRHWLSKLLEVAFGGTAFVGTPSGIRTSGLGTQTSGAGSTATVLQVDDASHHSGGTAVAVPTGTNGALEAREVKAVDTGATPDEITTKLALSSAPTTDNTEVYAANTIYADPYGDPSPTLQVLCEGKDTGARWLVCGGACTAIAFDVGKQTIPQIKFTFTFASIYLADGAAAGLPVGIDTHGSALGVLSYSDDVTLIEKDSECRIASVGDSVLANAPLRNITDLKIEFPGFKYEDIKTPSGQTGIGGWIRVEGSPLVRVSFTEPRNDLNTWETLRDYATSVTPQAFFYQIGSSATRGCCLISVPNCQVVGPDQAEKDAAGISSVEVMLESRHDTDTTDASSSRAGADLARSAFRMHFF